MLRPNTTQQNLLDDSQPLRLTPADPSWFERSSR